MASTASLAPVVLTASKPALDAPKPLALPGEFVGRKPAEANGQVKQVVEGMETRQAAVFDRVVDAEYLPFVIAGRGESGEISVLAR